MCLFSRSRPAWEEDVVFANRRHRHSHGRRRSRVVSETIITSRPTPQYISAPPTPPPPAPSTPKLAPPPSPPPAAPTPRPRPAPSPPLPSRIELVSVEEDSYRASPRGSRASVSVSVSTHKKSRHGSRGGGEEVYIERERERVRLPPVEPPRSREDFETYRYVHGSGHMAAGPMEELPRRSSRSITYESNPRVGARVTERERVVIEDDGTGRRKEYYRRP